MNTWEQFINDQILNGKDYPASIAAPIIEKTLTLYRQNQFESVGELVQTARKELEMNYLLYKGVTVKELSKRNFISDSTARRLLKSAACAKSKNIKNEWVYRG